MKMRNGGGTRQEEPRRSATSLRASSAHSRRAISAAQRAGGQFEEDVGGRQLLAATRADERVALPSLPLVTSSTRCSHGRRSCRDPRRSRSTAPFPDRLPRRYVAPSSSSPTRCLLGSPFSSLSRQS